MYIFPVKLLISEEIHELIKFSMIFAGIGDSDVHERVWLRRRSKQSNYCPEATNNARGLV
jgi:hypothetical protein